MALNKLDGEQINQASTTQKGVVQLATDEEVATGTSTQKTVSVKQLADNTAYASAAKKGTVKIMTDPDMGYLDIYTEAY